MAGIWPPWPFPGRVPAICRLPWSIKADPTTPQANPSPHLPSPRAASPSPPLSCLPERGRRRAAVDPAATDHCSPLRQVQELRRGPPLLPRHWIGTRSATAVAFFLFLIYGHRATSSSTCSTGSPRARCLDPTLSQ